jgi:hypothetical protein
MMQAMGCNVDSDCPNNLHCDSTGRCVTPPTYTKVVVAKLGDGDGTIVSSPAGINCGTTCSAMFPDGQALTLTATPSAGSTVAGFSVGCNSNTTSCTLTPTDPTTDLQVLVNFSLGSALPPAAVCNGAGYCWENPRPQGNRLNKVIVVGTNDEWAVGDGGTIVHRTAAGVTLPVSGVTRNLYGVYMSGTDIFAVGEAGTILHTSGGTWTAETSGVQTDLYDVVATGGTVFAIGNAGVILRRIGTSWSKDTSPTTQDLRAIAAAPSGDLYGVGSMGTVIHYTAGKWTASTDAALANHNLNGIAIPATGTPLYMTSAVGEIFRLSVGTYTRVYQNATADLRAITATATGVTAVGQQTGALILTSSDGTNYTAQSLSTQPVLTAVAAGPSEVTAVGDLGAMLRYDGTTWTPLSSGLGYPLRAIHGIDAQHAFAAGLTGTLLFWNGAYFAPAALGGTPPSFYGVYMVSTTEAWAVGTGGAIWHWNGASWSAVSSPTSNTLRAVWAASATQVYAVGDAGVILSYDGKAWTQLVSPTGVNLSAIAGSSAGDVWAGGDNGTVLHSTGSGFGVVNGALTTTGTVGGIWVGGVNNVFFAADTTMYHYDGATYAKSTTPVSGLRSVAGSGSEVWAVGGSGALLHYNGNGWDLFDTGTRRDLYGTFLGPTKQWIVGDGGALLSRAR